MSKRVDLINKEFGRLKGIKPTGKIINHSIKWEFECKCGNSCVATANDVMYCGKNSCGCLKHEEDLKHIAKAREHQLKVFGTDIHKITSNKLQSNNTSGVRGVSWHKKSQMWQVRIAFQGKPYHLGYYRDINEAKDVRKLAEHKLYGEFLEWYKKYTEIKGSLIENR